LHPVRRLRAAPCLRPCAALQCEDDTQESRLAAGTQPQPCGPWPLRPPVPQELRCGPASARTRLAAARPAHGAHDGRRQGTPRPCSLVGTATKPPASPLVTSTNLRPVKLYVAAVYTSNFDLHSSSFNRLTEQERAHRLAVRYH